MPLTLRWKAPTDRAVSGEGLRPETLRGPALDVSRQPIFAGQGTLEIGDLFDVSGDGGDDHLIFEGDLRQVRGLARGMTSGVVEIRGDAGSRLGEGMSGGSINVEGSVGDWAGAEMLGGFLRVKGSSGDFLGSSLPGSRVGMRDGVILVEGDAGEDAGLAIRRGLIAVGGDVGDGAGRGMVAGSVFVFGKVGKHPGAGMKRGTLGVFGPVEPELLPTFEPSGSFRSPLVTIYLKQLRDWGFLVPEDAFSTTIRRYNGDRVEGGRGEVWVGSLAEAR